MGMCTVHVRLEVREPLWGRGSAGGRLQMAMAAVQGDGQGATEAEESRGSGSKCGSSPQLRQ